MLKSKAELCQVSVINYEPVQGQYSTGFVIHLGLTEFAIHTVMQLMLVYISQTCLWIRVILVCSSNRVTTL